VPVLSVVRVAGEVQLDALPPPGTKDTVWFTTGRPWLSVTFALRESELPALTDPAVGSGVAEKVTAAAVSWS
jgi:hypothetical protein